MVELKEAKVLDYVRFVLSTIILLFSLVVTSYAIVQQQTHFWEAVPGWAALLLFIVDLFILGIVEGLQIALVELKRQHPDAYKSSHPAAYRIGQLAARSDNVERFLMGRQVFVVFLVFFAAKLTTIQLEEGEKFLFPAPDWFQNVFLETGILACIVVVILAQLMPQIVAAKFPVHFLQLFVMWPAYWACIFVECTGLTHVCWLLSGFWGYVTGMADDDTTRNPNEMSAELELRRLEATLEITVDGADNDSARGVSESGSDEKDPDASGATYGRFSELVDCVNENVCPDTLRVVRHYLDSHPEKFSQFPSVIGSKMYPAPHAIAQQIEKDGYDVPRFLSDISDPDHVPPHIVACELLAQNRQLQEEITLLKAKMESLTKT